MNIFPRLRNVKFDLHQNNTVNTQRLEKTGFIYKSKTMTWWIFAHSCKLMWFIIQISITLHIKLRKLRPLWINIVIYSIQKFLFNAYWKPIYTTQYLSVYKYLFTYLFNYISPFNSCNLWIINLNTPLTNGSKTIKNNIEISIFSITKGQRKMNWIKIYLKAFTTPLT